MNWIITKPSGLFATTIVLILATTLLTTGCNGSGRDVRATPVATRTPSDIPTPLTSPQKIHQPEVTPKPDGANEESQQPMFTLTDKLLLFAGGYADPSVLQMDDGTFLMYLNRSKEIVNNPGVFILSSQDGLSWEEITDTVFRGVAVGRAVKFPDGVRYYYHQPPGRKENVGSIMSSFSEDGITNWRDEGVRVRPQDGYAAVGPTVVQLRNGTYRMFFHEAKLDESGKVPRVPETIISAASSPDGLTWIRDEKPALVPDEQIEGGRILNARHPFAMPWGNGYLMLYWSGPGILAAYSDDGFNWVKLGPTGITGADNHVISLPDGTYRLYYGGGCEGEPDCADAGPGTIHTGILSIELPAALAPEPTATQPPRNEEPQNPSFELNGSLCRPEGPGPFPAVIYNHGGSGGAQIGGAPAETCEALAEAGFVGFAPIRSEEWTMEERLEYVLETVDYVKSLDYVDSSRIGIIGFSQGGLLTFMAATQRSDFSAIVLMAMAANNKILEDYLPRAGDISAPALLLISENDNAVQDHLQLMLNLEELLQSEGKQADLIIYPPYKNDGHLMFFEVGEYWADVLEFLQQHLE